MAISEKKMRIVIDNYFKSLCNVNTSIYEAFEKGFRTGVKKGSVGGLQGQWINGFCTNGTHYRRCSQCFAAIDETFFSYDFDVNYCPTCGADMRGEDNG